MKNGRIFYIRSRKERYTSHNPRLISYRLTMLWSDTIMALVLLALWNPLLVVAQYRIRYIYANSQCTTLLAIKSESLLEEAKDGDRGQGDDQDDSSSSSSLSFEQQMYNECVNELAEEEEKWLDGDDSFEYNIFSKYGCSYAEETFEGVEAFQTVKCSWEREEVTNGMVVIPNLNLFPPFFHTIRSCSWCDCPFPSSFSFHSHFRPLFTLERTKV